MYQQEALESNEIKKEGKSWFFDNLKVIDERDPDFDPYAPYTNKKPPPVVVKHKLTTKGKGQEIDPSDQPLLKQQKSVFKKLVNIFSCFRWDMEIMNAKQNKLYDRMYPGGLEDDGMVRELGPTFEMPSELISTEEEEEEVNPGATEATSSRKGKEIVEEESEEEENGSEDNDDSN